MNTMKKATIAFITSAALAFAMPLYAADKTGMKSDSQQKAGTHQGMKSDAQRQEGLTQQQTGEMQSGHMITADKLQGMTVVSQEGKAIGEIEKITIDKQSGEVQFVTFSRGGILGMGGKEVAAPLSAFEFGDEEAILTVDQSKLENVPQQTAEATDSDYQRDLETHYGVAPAWNKGDSGDTLKNQQDQDPTKPGKVDTQN
ncbi:PRC-barrel domain-containing protein [Desulfosarcina sp.]|uniref:PRC-barrel domain-containing protein n=1 Tax=Desulfosarcina sp. TaxID=2027861 RepID=UPI0039707FD0